MWAVRPARCLDPSATTGPGSMLAPVSLVIAPASA